MGSGAGVPPDPVSGVWDPHLDRGPRSVVPASSIGWGLDMGGTPKPPVSCLRHQGGQSPLDHPRAAELPDPDRLGSRTGTGPCNVRPARDGGRKDDPGRRRTTFVPNGSPGYRQAQVVALLLLVPGPRPRTRRGPTGAPRPVAPLGGPPRQSPRLGGPPRASGTGGSWAVAPPPPWAGSSGFGAPPGPLGGPCGAPSKKCQKWHFLDPCGAKPRGGGGAPPTNLILLRNQC